jgi:hypothetical protein
MSVSVLSLSGQQDYSFSKRLKYGQKLKSMYTLSLVSGYVLNTVLIRFSLFVALKTAGLSAFFTSFFSHRAPREVKLNVSSVDIRCNDAV